MTRPVSYLRLIPYLLTSLTTVPLITPELAWVRLTWRWDGTKSDARV